MKGKFWKKALPFLLTAMALASTCSAAETDWKFGTNDGSDAECYIDASRSWFDGKEGNGFTKVENRRTGYYVVYSLKFTDLGNGTFNALMAHGQVYDKSGNYVSADDGTTTNVIKAESTMGKVCNAIMGIKKKTE